MKQYNFRRTIWLLLLFTITVAVPLSACKAEYNAPGGTSQPGTTDAPVNPALSATEPAVSDEPFQAVTPAYGWQSLSDDTAKMIYRDIEEHLNDSTAPVLTYQEILYPMQMNKVLSAIILDHPEAFWLCDGCEVQTKNGQTTIRFHYALEERPLEDSKKQATRALEQILEGIPNYQNEFYRELAIFDWVVDHCEVDEKMNQKYNDGGKIPYEDSEAYLCRSIYNPLVGKASLYEEYVRTFQLLCNKAGIECVTVRGEDQLWNCVRINGDWYHADTLYSQFYINDVFHPEEHYDYFNLNDKQISQDHERLPLFPRHGYSAEDGNVFLPKCSSEEESYYHHFGVMLKDLDKGDDVINALAACAAKKEGKCCIVLDEGLDFKSTAISLNTDGYLKTWIEQANRLSNGGNQIKTSFQITSNERFRTVIVYLHFE